MRISDWSSDVCSSDLGGSFNFTVSATDSSTGTGAPYSGSLAYALTVAAPTITVSPATLPDGTTGAAYSQTISASGDTAPYSFALAAGSLPAGLTLSAAGVLSGTPTAFGRSEEHTSELQSLMRISYAVFCLKNKNTQT